MRGKPGLIRTTQNRTTQATTATPVRTTLLRYPRLRRGRLRPDGPPVTATAGPVRFVMAGGGTRGSRVGGTGGGRAAGALRPGDVALLDQADLDRALAQVLISARVSAVLDARPAISGRFPSLGSELLVSAGIPLVDDLGEEILHGLRDGDQVQIDGATVTRRGTVLATGTRQDPESVAAALAAAEAGLCVQLQAFASNVAEYLLHERGLLLDRIGVPALRTSFTGRHALVVSLGYGRRDDLAGLRRYIRTTAPVLVGVDGGADTLAAAGYRPDLIVGDLDAVSERTLACGAELVAGGPVPGQARLRQLGLTAVLFPAAASGEDLALLLADAGGAELIVTAGGPATLREFLDRGSGVSTFLTRLTAGAAIVDVRAMARLSRPAPPYPALLLAALVAGTVAALASLGDPTVWWPALLRTLHR
jgi:uncharacterized membrane-anchored protein